MLIEAVREIPHDPTDTPWWSESYLFQGFAPAAGVGFYHHLGRVPDDSALWRGVFATCLPGGAVLAMKDYGRTDNGWGAESAALAFTCEEPWRRWSVTYDGAARLTSSEALAAGALADGRSIPVRMELSFDTSTPAWSFGPVLADGGRADVHYEQPGCFIGRLFYDGLSVDLSGTGYRDHRVGASDLRPMDSRTCLHGGFPSGRSFQARIGHAQSDQRFTSAYVAVDGELHEARLKKAPAWTGSDGDPGHFTVRLETDIGPVEIEGRTLPQRFHWSAPDQADFILGADLNDRKGWWPCLETTVAYRWDGETGYGSLEVTRPRS